MRLTITEFRKNIREALNAVDAGELVIITRHNKEYMVVTSSNWNDSQTQAARTGATRLVTNEISSNIRPNLPKVNEFEDAIETESSCCKLKNPCKHWTYDQNKELWVNSLSGREKEIES